MKRYIILMFSILATYCLQATTQDSLKVFTLPTVRVIITKPSEAIGAVHLIEAQDKDNSLSLKEALSTGTGISATVGSKDESNVRLRGFRKNEVKVMVDGRPLNNGYFGNVDLSKLSLLNISEIQVIKGPVSPLYGTNAMGGVINLITKSPAKDNWATIKGMFKRNNTRELSLSSAHDFNSWDYQVGVSNEFSDGFMLSQDFVPALSETGKVRNSSAKQQWNFMGDFSADVFTFQRAGLDFSYTTMDRREIPSSIYEIRKRLYDYWIRYHAGLSSEGHLSEDMFLSTMLALDGGKDRYLEYNDSAMHYLKTDSRMQDQTLNFAPRLRVNTHNGMTWDFGSRTEIRFFHREDNVEYQQGIDKLLAMANVYTQMECNLSPNYRLTTALGISYLANEKRDKAYLAPEPAIGLVKSYPSGAQSSLGIGYSTAQPTMRQLYSMSKGNPDLMPQNSWKCELEQQQPLWGNRMSASASAFLNSTRNLIDLQAGRYANIYRIKTYGGELSILVAWTGFWQSQAEYAYLNYFDNDGYIITESPRHTVSLIQRVNLPLHSRLTLSSHFHDQRYSQDDGGTNHLLPSYILHDVFVDIPWHKYKLQLGLENILDENYEGEYGFPEAGINFNIGFVAEI